MQGVCMSTPVNVVVANQKRGFKKGEDGHLRRLANLIATEDIREMIDRKKFEDSL